MLLYEYRGAVERALREEQRRLKDKLVETDEYQKADKLRGRILGLQQAEQMLSEVVERFLAAEDPGDDNDNLPEQQ